jgi:hypothetical protein
MRHCTIYNIFLTLDEYTELKHLHSSSTFFGHVCNFSQSELFYLCRFHSDMATCNPTLFLLTMKEILLVHFIITNFRVAHKMLCTPWLRNPLTILRLFASAAKRPWRQFFSRFVKVRFRILDIQITNSDNNNCITDLILK